jgi:hypothetical protein
MSGCGGPRPGQGEHRQDAAVQEPRHRADPAAVSAAGAALILPSRTRARAARLATRNTKDFTDTGIGIIDPWEHSGSA